MQVRFFLCFFSVLPLPLWGWASGTSSPHTTIAPTNLGETVRYASSTVSPPLKVNPSIPNITWNTPAPVVYGTALSAAQLNASADVPGRFSYNPTLGTVLSSGTQILLATFTPLDRRSSKMATASVTLTVSPADPSVSWPVPSTIVYGTALSESQLNATANIPGRFSYSPAIGTVLNAGSQTLSVTFTPSDGQNYKTVTAHTTFRVSQATPILSWPPPPAITYGRTLSATQLNSTSDVSGTFTYSPGKGTVLNTGTQTLTVTFTPGNKNYSSATAHTTLQVSQAKPVITWPNPAATTYNTPLSEAQLSATANVSGTFVYSPGLGSILNAGAQPLSVTFTPGDKNYSAATTHTTLQVNQAKPLLTWPAPAAITYNTPLSATQLNATANISGAFSYSPGLGSVLNAGTQTLSVTFTPSDKNYSSATAHVTLQVSQATPVIIWPAPAAVSYNTGISATQLNATANIRGTLAYSPEAGTILNAGPQTLSVIFTPTDKNYSSATAHVMLQVNQAAPLLTWANPVAITYGASLSATQLNATANGSGTFAYLPAQGTILNAGAQTLGVTFTPSDSKNFSTVTAQASLQVNQAAPVVTWPTPAAITYGMPLSAAQLNATANVSGTFAYSRGQGTILSAGAQTLGVTFTPSDSKNYATATAQASLQVNQAAPLLTWPTPAAITYGMPLSAAQLNATANVSGTFAYSPSQGTILGAGAQTLGVTFTPSDSKNYATATAQATLQVNQAAPVVTWPMPAAITYGTSLSATQLNATANVSGTFAYLPGQGTALNAGTQTLGVTFTPSDSKNYATVTAQATLQVNQAAPVVTWPMLAAITYGMPLSAAQLNATANVSGTFAYSPSQGTVLNAGAQTLGATFTPSDSKNYATVTAQATLQVNQAAPLLTWPAPAAITYNTPLSATQLNATANVSGIFAYSPGQGTILNAGAQTLGVTFTPSDSKNYSTATAQATLQVNQAAPVVTWPMPAAITYGTSLSATQLNATANVSGTFAYSPGQGTILNAGAQTLGVTFTPSDKNYSTATAHIALEVDQATPIVTWPTPAPITYPTRVTSVQLNATANVSGKFYYSPTYGAWLQAGTQPLSVTFVPTDSVNYMNTVAQTTLEIDPVQTMLQWGTSAPIAVNMPLSAAGLTVSAVNPLTKAGISGTISWTPSLDTRVSSAGAQNVTATFTPNDPVNYAAAQSTTTLTVLPFGVVCWGDSLMGGSGSSSFPAKLGKVLSLPVVNMSVGGQTSTQIGVRNGAVPTLAVISGGVIPATGSVGISFVVGYEPATSVGPTLGVTGTIAGVPGVVTYTAQGLLFTRTLDGDPVAADVQAPFLVDTPYTQYLPIFWEGRNDYGHSSQVLADIAAEVARVAPGQDYLVLSIPNGDISTEYKGGYVYQEILALDNQLANIYGSHYLDVRSLLVNAYDPNSILDTTNYQHDVPPTSVRAVLGSGQLSGDIGPDDTTFTVNLSSGALKQSEILTIDSGANVENVQISSISGATVTVVRGVAGSNAAHAAGTAVTVIDYLHLNPAGLQIVANAAAAYLQQYASPAQ